MFLIRVESLWNSYDKVFGRGTKLVVTDKSSDADFSPKPTIFLPSVAETTLHKAGTYICLLENFFPDVIKVDWKEKGGDRILKSQDGNSVRTSDTYMKVSWLTVTGESMNKEHRCIVRHEKNKGGVDQEILFPSVKEVITTMKPTEANLMDANAVTTINPTEADVQRENVINSTDSEASPREEIDVLRLQLTNTSAYCSYLLLLLKSAIYMAIVTFCLLKRTAVCGNGNHC